MARVDRGAKGGEGPARGSNRRPRSTAHTYEVALAAQMVASSGPWPPAVLRIVARRLAQCTRGASRAPTGPLRRQLTDALVEHRSLPPSPPWAGRDGKGRSGSKGSEGPARDGNRCPCAGGSPFSADRPRLVRCNDFEDATKTRCCSSTDSAGVANSEHQTLIEYRAVALELVREHPWLTEAGSRQRPRQPAFSSSHLRGRVSGSDGRFERAQAPGCAEDCGEAFGPMRTRCLTRSYLGRWVVS